MLRKEILAGGVEVWLGDCRELLSSLPTDNTAVVIAPPYGIGHVKQATGRRAPGRKLSPAIAQQCLEFAECHFNGVQIGQMGRQIKDFRTYRLDRLFNASDFMHRQTIHDDDVSALECRLGLRIAIHESLNRNAIPLSRKICRPELTKAAKLPGQLQ
jgi:hypothetical protein